MGGCVCYTGVFLHQRTHLRTHSLQVVHICVYVYICVYACICIWMRMCVYDITWHVEALLLRFSIYAYVWICMRMYMCVHVCVYMCMFICMYMYINMSVYMYTYTFIYALVCMYICTRVGAFCLFVVVAVQYIYTHIIHTRPVHIWKHKHTCTYTHISKTLEIIIDLPIGLPINNIISQRHSKKESLQIRLGLRNPREKEWICNAHQICRVQFGPGQVLGS